MIRLLMLALWLAAASTVAAFPEAARQATANTYHGVAVADPYQWLEDWSSSEVKAWSTAQNAAARSVLDTLDGRGALAKQVETLTIDDSVSYYSGERIGDRAWFMKYAPPRQQPFIVQMDIGPAGRAERVVYDPAAAPSSNTSIEWFDVSPNGQLIAIALTVNGAEVADLHVFDLATSKLVDTILPRVNGPTAGGDLSWDEDSQGFYYTRYPREGEKSPADQNFYQQLWHRTLGTPLQDDRYELGREFDAIAEIRIAQQRPSGKLLVTMQYGDSGQFSLYLRDEKQRWHQLSQHEDQLVQSVFLDNNTLLAISRESASRGKFVTLDISALPKVSTHVLVAESDVALASDYYGVDTFVVHNDRIYAKVRLGGPEGLRVYDLNGKRLQEPLLEVAGVGQLLPWGDDLLFRHYSYLAPNSWLLFDGEKTSRHALSSISSADFSDYVVRREFATSKDGTKIPVNIILSKDTVLDGNNPLLLYGYGGYAISLAPRFDAVRKLWLDRGGIYAVANLRGGGEYGEDWHRQGMLTRKQNVFDDFHAAMRHLSKRGYTKPEKLALEGGSNGGLLMGAMITQHPKDMGVVISHVGIYDSLRSELSPNGAFNIPEFGSVKDLKQFTALRAYSPYHNVSKQAYPPVLFMTGENDGRVDPMHSRKMTAALQYTNTTKTPILLRTSGNTGHGSGTPLDETIAQQVDRLMFLFHNLNM